MGGQVAIGASLKSTWHIVSFAPEFCGRFQVYLGWAHDCSMTLRFTVVERAKNEHSHYIWSGLVWPVSVYCGPSWSKKIMLLRLHNFLSMLQRNVKLNLFYLDRSHNVTSVLPPSELQRDRSQRWDPRGRRRWLWWPGWSRGPPSPGWLARTFWNTLDLYFVGARLWRTGCVLEGGQV